MTAVRIGDVERDQAVSALGDHFAAGRLTRDEFDERADQAMQARYDADLAPLFADLPRPAAPLEPLEPGRLRPAWAGGPPRPFGGPPPVLFMLLPLVLVAAVAGAVIAHAPFLLWLLVWFVVIGRVVGHKRRWRSQQLGQQQGRPPQFSRPGRW